MDEASLLGVDPTEVPDVMEHFETETFRGRTYRRLSDGRHGIERGTVLVDETAVRGFPSIPRTLVLETGVPTYFDGPLAVEEKLNGYNVRIAGTEAPLAFTRGGLICPFSTDLARERLDLSSFFADHPELMLCAEFIGPENPYTAHEYPDVESVAIRIFDVRDRVSGTPLPVEERRDLLDEYGFAQPRLFGTYDPGEAPEAVTNVIESLEERGREGVVMQSLDGHDLLKYTTHAQHTDDLAFAFGLPFDYGRDFSFSRLIREGFQAVEREESPEAVRERAHDLGESLLEPMVETIRSVREGERVGERHTIRASPATVEDTLDHLRQRGIALEIRSDRSIDGERVVEFVKLMDSTQDSIEHYVTGGTIDK